VRHDFVLVAFGASGHLEACMESIWRQTKIPSSICIATSTPNDHILRIAARHGVQVLENPLVGGGISVDWNFALSVSTAEFVTLAHQDDLYEPTYSERMVSAMARHPDAIIGFSDSEEVGPDGCCSDSLNNKVKRLLIWRAFGSREAIRQPSEKRKLLSLGNPVCCPSVIFNKSNLGHFEFSSGLKSNLDWEAWVRLSNEAGAFVYLPEILVKKRNHPLSATAALIGSHRRLDEDRAMFERFWPKPVAAVLTQFYKLGYIGNEKATEQRDQLAGNEQHT
jgi:hypothetical protein